MKIALCLEPLETLKFQPLVQWARTQLHAVQVESSSEFTFAETVARVDALLATHSATDIELLHLMKMWDRRRALRLIDVALSFITEAERAYLEGRHDIAWAALSRGAYYTGLAQGEHGVSQGGIARKKKWNPLLEKILDLLSSANRSKPWVTKQCAWNDIESSVASYNDTLTPNTGRSKDPYEFFLRASKRKFGPLRAMLEQVMDGPILRGRPKRPR